MPGGVLGRHRYPVETDHVPVEGSGARIVDSRGRSFVDYSCGGGSLILGYGHPAVVEAVQRQAARSMQFVSIRNPLAIRLAERFTGMVGWADRVRFALSGAEAVMFALPARAGLHRAGEGAQVRRRLPRELRLRPVERGPGGGRIRVGWHGCRARGAGLGRDPTGDRGPGAGRPLQRPRRGAPDRDGGVAVPRRGHRGAGAAELCRPPRVPRGSPGSSAPPTASPSSSTRW